MENNKKVGLVACKRKIIIDKTYLNDETEKWIKTYGDLQEHLNLPIVDGIQYLDKSIFKSSFFLKRPLNKVGEPMVVLFKKELLNKVEKALVKLYSINGKNKTASTISNINKLNKN